MKTRVTPVPSLRATASVEPGNHDVDDDDDGSARCGELQTGRAVAGRRDLVPGALEIQAKRLDDHAVVFDQNNLHVSV